MNKTWCTVLCVAACFATAAMTTGMSYPRAIPAQQIAELRERGPEGLAEALRIYDTLVQQNASDRELAPWRKAIDQIGGQRTCSVSRLYWYTDLPKAQAESERTGKPILSLRMLGKLTDEFSCANSRFFRTALYSNKEISRYLRDHFVLHWQSVRPVPRVTIDFGDGRKLERTLTGNSAHYVLSSDGQPLDALPGLYSPQRFLSWLWNIRSLHEQMLAMSESERPATLKSYHRSRRDALVQQWAVDIGHIKEPHLTLVSSRIDSAVAAARAAGRDAPAPDAGVAARRAVAKTAGEAPLLRFANLGGQWLERGMDDEAWKAIARQHREDVKLDESSTAVMRQEFPRAVQAARLAETKWVQEAPILRMVRLFEDSIALDTVRNEYLLHRRIHERFADGQPESVDSLNEWIYAELFLTPNNDPWLGLAPADVYTALENGGLRQ